MKIEVFEREKTKYIDLVRFVADGINVELANALRRIIMSEVPSMAIYEILFVENDSVLYDEMISNRLALIPLTTDLKSYNLPDECSCGGEGCSLCQAEFVLEKVVGRDDEPQNVYSSDLDPLDPKIKPVSDTVLIAKLASNTSLVLEAYARLGRGKDHVKHQPVCGIGYCYYPKITIDNSKFESEDQIDEIVTKDHCKIFEKKDGELVLKDDYWQRADLIGSSTRYASEGAIKEESEPGKFIFTIEGTGALPLAEVLETGCNIFLEKIEELDNFIGKTKVIEQETL